MIMHDLGKHLRIRDVKNKKKSQKKLPVEIRGRMVLLQAGLLKYASSFNVFKEPQWPPLVLHGESLDVESLAELL